MKYIDRTGMTFTYLTVLERVPNKTGIRVLYKCICKCGKIVNVQSGNLVSGDTKSCGCRKIEKSIERNLKHGASKTIEYSSYLSMIRRCMSKKHCSYKNYGGRGILVCKEWLNSFENFYKDMGPRPSKNHSIDRINVNGNYTKENCKWSTRSEQQKNKRRNKIFLSKHKYVTKDKIRNKWIIRIKNKFYGYYENEIVAAIKANHYRLIHEGKSIWKS